MSQTARFTVWTPDGFIAPGQSHDYGAGKTRYNRTQEPQAARLFNRKADATRALKQCGEGQLVQCKLWFGPYPVPNEPMEEAA
jgi:hypothetical protein